MRSRSHLPSSGATRTVFHVLAMATLALTVLMAVPPSRASDKVHPLAPLDTSSPRATLLSFLRGIDEFGRRGIEYEKTPTADRYARVAEQNMKVRRLLDLSEVAAVSRVEAGTDALVLLWDVLGRIEIPKEAEVPDSRAMKERREAGSPDRWSIPNTEITIARVEKGDRAGEYLFSPSTVARLSEFHARVAHLPYLRPMAIEHPWQVAQLWGGPLFPPKWTQSLPVWLKASLGDQVAWKWLALAAVLCAVAVVVWIVHWWAGRTMPSHRARTFLRQMAAPAAFLFLVPLIEQMTSRQINVTGMGAQTTQLLVPALTYLALAWLVWKAAIFLAEIIIASPRIPDQGLDAHLLRLVARVLGLIGMVLVLFWGGNQLGIPMYGLIAGVGVGGLAVALAAQGTLENFLGSVNLFADRPVRVGEVCIYGDAIGTVEEIGLRSTRLRGLDRTVTTVPNADFSKMKIVNLSRRDRILLKTLLHLRYDITSDQLRYLLTRLREMLVAHPRVLSDSFRVRLVSLGEASLKVEMLAYVDTSDYGEFLAVREDVFLRTIDLVAEAGTGFALPSRTLYLSRDKGLDPSSREAAQDAVQAWRDGGRLPFPNLDAAAVQRLKDTLDWPPRGAPSPSGA